MSNRELVIELTTSEQWAMTQVAGVLSRANEMARVAHEEHAKSMQGLEASKEISSGAERHRAEFVASVLKAHKKADPGTPPSFTESDLGMRLTWPPKPKPEKNPKLKSCPTCPSSPPNLMKVSDKGCCGQCSDELKAQAEGRMADE